MQKELPKVLAELTPQAWINDYAVEVDAEGPNTYDVTPEVLEMTLQHLTDVLDGVAFLDYLTDAKAAPEWIRKWSGPFEIHLVPETLKKFLNALARRVVEDE